MAHTVAFLNTASTNVNNLVLSGPELIFTTLALRARHSRHYSNFSSPQDDVLVVWAYRWNMGVTSEPRSIILHSDWNQYRGTCLRSVNLTCLKPPYLMDDTVKISEAIRFFERAGLLPQASF